MRSDDFDKRIADSVPFESTLAIDSDIERNTYMRAPKGSYKGALGRRHPMEKRGQVDEDELFRQLAFGVPRRLEPGRSYLVKERKPGKAWDLFERMLDEGYEGLYVTRQHPNHVENAHGPRTLKVVWLSTTLGRDYVDPHNLNALTNLINGFVQSPRKTIVLIDGIEYLRLNNDADRVLKFVEVLDEIVMQRQGVLLLSLDYRAFDPRELAFLERNSIVLE